MAHLSTAERQHIIQTARDWIGTPYRHQASLQGHGCDCLGLVRGIWREIYHSEPEAVPAYSPDWAEADRSEKLAQAARRNMSEIDKMQFTGGDLLLFRWRPHLPAKHLAIATFDKTMVHAQQGAVVCEVPLSGWWLRHLSFSFEFPSQEHE